MNRNLLKKALVRIPNRSGFDKSFQSLLTMPVGTIVPLMLDEIPANTKVNLKAVLSATLPPLVSDTFLRCDLAVEAFFVPFRQLYRGFEFWLSGEKVYNGAEYKPVATPVLQLNLANANDAKVLKPGTLADYLGFKAISSQIAKDERYTITLSAYPFLAYQWVYDCWYRNKLLTHSLFDKTTVVSPSLAKNTRYLPYQVIGDDSEVAIVSTNLQGGRSLYDLRQRCYGLDYFTACAPSPQMGSAPAVTIDTSGDEGSFTISSLRAINAIQQFRERNNFCGEDYADWLHVNFGSNLKTGVLNEPIFLGSGRIPVYSKGVEVNSNTTGSSTIQNSNPFGKSTGARYGSVYANGNVPLCDGFVSQEPGYILVNISLVPKPTYSSGVSRALTRYRVKGSQAEMPLPVLQGVGPQPVYLRELFADAMGDDVATEESVFGYIDRYADFMTREDEVHGLYRDGESLQSFAHQRTFTTGVTINTAFSEIDPRVLDQLTTVSAGVSGYGVMVDSFLDYKVSMPLQQFSIPSLENVDGEAILVERQGKSIKG